MKQIHRHSELALGHLGTIKVLLGVSSNTASIKGKETVEKWSWKQRQVTWQIIPALKPTNIPFDEELLAIFGLLTAGF